MTLERGNFFRKQYSFYPLRLFWANVKMKELWEKVEEYFFKIISTEYSW